LPAAVIQFTLLQPPPPC